MVDVHSHTAVISSCSFFTPDGAYNKLFTSPPTAVHVSLSTPTGFYNLERETTELTAHGLTINEFNKSVLRLQIFLKGQYGGLLFLLHVKFK